MSLYWVRANENWWDMVLVFEKALVRFSSREKPKIFTYIRHGRNEKF
jgi:hypothetical protein